MNRLKMFQNLCLRDEKVYQDLLNKIILEKREKLNEYEKKEAEATDYSEKLYFHILAKEIKDDLND